MVDHPLVADDLRQYIQRHKIEDSLNVGLNEVLSTLPQDPFSVLAATLIDVSSALRAPHYSPIGAAPWLRRRC